MFENEVGSARASWTMPFSFAFQCLLVLALMVLPLVNHAELSATDLIGIMVPPPSPPAPPPPPVVAIVDVPRSVRSHFDEGQLIAPKEIPDVLITDVVSPPPGIASLNLGVPGGTGDPNSTGWVPRSIGDIGRAKPPLPPPPVAPKKQETLQRIRVGGSVQKARILKQVTPAYPNLARSARIQGAVILKAVIGKDGSIKELEVATGHPLLVPAALQAVRQWRYKPTLLNGQAVEVSTQIEVNFTLN